jgi:hypothetical protein
MKNKKTKKQLERAAARRSIKAARQQHHEKNAENRAARKRTVTSARGRVITLDRPGSKARRRQRRNGASLRVGGR